jgi:hypothetical protein
MSLLFSNSFVVPEGEGIDVWEMLGLGAFGVMK